MTAAIITVHIIVCFALILIVLLQTGKGQDMGAAFGGASQTQTYRIGVTVPAGVAGTAVTADLRARKLLDEFRGMPQVEKDKLAGILQTVGNISLLHPEIAEIDLNPIIIQKARPVVADALIVLKSEE